MKQNCSFIYVKEARIRKDILSTAYLSSLKMTEEVSEQFEESEVEKEVAKVYKALIARDNKNTSKRKESNKRVNVSHLFESKETKANEMKDIEKSIKSIENELRNKSNLKSLVDDCEKMSRELANIIEMNHQLQNQLFEEVEKAKVISKKLSLVTGIPLFD